MTTQTDPRITELLDLASIEGLPLALRPETIVAIEDAGWLCHPFTGQLFREQPGRPPVLALDVLVSTLHELGGVLCLVLLLLSLLAPLPVQASGQRGTPPVPRCRVVHGTRVCLPVNGGSGITPPVLRRPQ